MVKWITLFVIVACVHISWVAVVVVAEVPFETEEPGEDHRPLVYDERVVSDYILLNGAPPNYKLNSRDFVHGRRYSTGSDPMAYNTNLAKHEVRTPRMQIDKHCLLEHDDGRYELYTGELPLFYNGASQAVEFFTGAELGSCEEARCERGRLIIAQKEPASALDVFGKGYAEECYTQVSCGVIESKPVVIALTGVSCGEDGRGVCDGHARCDMGDD